MHIYRRGLDQAAQPQALLTELEYIPLEVGRTSPRLHLAQFIIPSSIGYIMKSNSLINDKISSLSRSNETAEGCECCTKIVALDGSPIQTRYPTGSMLALQQLFAAILEVWSRGSMVAQMKYLGI